MIYINTIHVQTKQKERKRMREGHNRNGYIYIDIYVYKNDTIRTIFYFILSVCHLHYQKIRIEYDNSNTHTLLVRA